MGVLYVGRYGQRDISLFNQREVGLSHLGVGLETDREDIYIYIYRHVIYI